MIEHAHSKYIQKSFQRHQPEKSADLLFGTTEIRGTG